MSTESIAALPGALFHLSRRSSSCESGCQFAVINMDASENNVDFT